MAPPQVIFRLKKKAEFLSRLIALNELNYYLAVRNNVVF
jgi:hypothetical protein